MAHARLFCAAATALLAGALAGGCSNSPPVDMYFGTDVGADFRAPITDAGAGDTNVTPDSAATATGTGGGTGTGGAAGSDGTGTGGAGAGGAAGQAAATAGSGGAAGAGS